MAEYKTFGSAYQKDAEFLRGRKFNRDEELSVLGVSAGVLGAVEDVNRQTLANLIEIVYAQEAQPLQQIVAETANLWIRHHLGIAGWELRFRKPNFKDDGVETRNAQIRLTSGQSTMNQELARQGKPAVPGGNRYYMTSNMVQVGYDPEDDVGMRAPPNESLAIEEPEPEPAEPKAEPKAAAVIRGLSELRNWKRVAMATAKGERAPRPFACAFLPSDLQNDIRAQLEIIGLAPPAVRSFFDTVIASVEDRRSLEGGLGTAQATEQEYVEMTTTRIKAEWPDWMQERYRDRAEKDAAFATASVAARRERLEVG